MKIQICVFYGVALLDIISMEIFNLLLITSVALINPWIALGRILSLVLSVIGLGRIIVVL